MQRKDQFDAIVVGARCAGASTAMLLARRGLRVLLVDRARFPSDTLSSHYLQQVGARLLHQWGLHERMAATGCPPVRQMRLDFGKYSLAGFTPSEGDPALPDFCPRRRVLDSLLIEVAVEAGVELRTGFHMQELITGDRGVSGIVGRSRTGTICRDHAPIVIGADGMRSFVARSVRAASYDEVPPLTCNVFSYFADVPMERAELYSRPGLFIITAPTHENLTQVIVIRPRDQFVPLRNFTDEQFFASLDEVPALAERVRCGRRAEPYYGTADLPFFFRKPYGPGWALVGDAGHFKDPITAQGMTNAFQQATWLADAILVSFSGRKSFERAMRDYERRRNAELKPMSDFTHELAKLHPPPRDIERVLRAAAEVPEEADQFFGIFGGTVAKDDFFAAEHTERLLRQVKPSRARRRRAGGLAAAG